MSIQQNVDAKALGKRYAEIVREGKLPVQGIWVRNGEEHPEIWIVTQPLKLEQMRSVYESRVELRQSFLEAEYQVNTVNPEWIPEFTIQSDIPDDAHEIELRT